MIDSIEVVVNGRTYTAERVVSGRRALRQVIRFRGHEEVDSQTYRRDQAGAMRATAELMLWQLLTRGWPGQSPLEPLPPPD